MTNIFDAIGKTFSHQSTWNGDYDNFAVECINITDFGSIALEGRDRSGRATFGYITTEILYALLTEGKFVEEREIERCTVRDTYELK